ncbi:MAG TPA: GIY-YIG nuclease family protein, partial [Candidatus Baltobacteraceae bacterium]|nr:GIY-YIG nuclease family protein [Candidatus Baltobacteraceae bacterium]
DVSARVRQHNDGISKWTRSRGPWNLVWISAPASLTEARKLENLLKKQKGGEGFHRLTGIKKLSGMPSS